MAMIRNGYIIKPKANLYEANLEGASLYRADLTDVNLRGADLGEADLREANLMRVNLLGMTIDDGQGNIYECQMDGWHILESK